MRIALVPFNPIIGDLAGNSRRICERARAAGAQGADLVVFPELAMTGYPPRDLLLRPSFLRMCDAALREIGGALGATPALLGAPLVRDGRLRNSAVLLRDGGVAFSYDKQLLPAYDVFDEPRYFTPGDAAGVFELGGRRVGVAICEDLWRAQDVGDDADYDARETPAAKLKDANVDIVACLTASPFVVGKDERQQAILGAASAEIGAPIVSVNQHGANDELIFDGAPHYASPDVPCKSAPRFDGATVYVDTDEAEQGAPWGDGAQTDENRALWDALTLGVRDYAAKTGFSTCVLGLSGGVDSALVCALASAALGSENVLAIGMPSRYSSVGSLSDAKEQCERTGVRFREVPIEDAHRACEGMLGDAVSGGRDAELAGENMQARLRGLIVMAASNAHGMLPLATGNKSELAVGYCTLYGDMNGGLAPIADLYKTRVYALSRWINAHPAHGGFGSPPIPEAVLTKAPSAELRPDQTDQDSLPPYEELDAALLGLIEERLSPDEARAARGLSEDAVATAARLLAISEYKRRQMAIGLKVSTTAFGTGRRMPVAKRESSAEGVSAPSSG